MKRRPNWSPPRQPWSITDQQARAVRRAFAGDECTCTHQRSAHTGDYGKVAGCTVRGCTCQNYAHLREVARS